MSAAPWEAYLAERFPGYLLPAAQRRALPEEAAARFLDRFGARPDHLYLLRAASVVARSGALIRDFALRHLPDLARRLPPRAAAPEAWEGRAPGRLDARATLRCRLEGRTTRFVGRAPARAGDPRRPPRPEDALVKATAQRLVEVLENLAQAGLLGASSSPAGWADGIAACAPALQRLLASTPLADISSLPHASHAPRAPPELLSVAHEQAALAAPHPAYALAARLHRALRENLDANNFRAIARALAEGALAPLGAPTRFELAVLIRLLEALEQRLAAEAPGCWAIHQTAVLRERREVAHLEGPGGRHLRLYYNQACLPPGPHERGARRYFGREARLRPDLVLVAEAPGVPPRAVAVEVKLSSDPGYLVQGYQEALLYRLEYAAQLTGWPKAILVIPGSIGAPPSPEDDVIAVGWERWVPEVVLDGLLAGL